MENRFFIRRIVSPRAVRISILQTALVASSFALLVLTDVSSGQEELLTELPKQIRAFGTVKDSSGNPIEGAGVTLITPVSSEFSMVPYWIEKPEYKTSETNMNGEFSVEFPPDTPGLRNANMQNKVLLAVSLIGYQTTVKPVELDRLFVELPIEIELLPHAPRNIQVLDSDSQPVAGAIVHVAKFAGARIPRQRTLCPDQVTDEQGWARITNFDIQQIEQIYVVSAAHGNQQVELKTDEGKRIGTLQKTGKVKGRIALPADADQSQLAGKTIHLTTGVNRNFQIGTWQSTELDKEGRFSFDHVGFGSLSFQLTGMEEMPFAIPATRAMRNPENLSGENTPLQIEIPYVHARQMVFRFVDEDDQPLPGLSFGLMYGAYDPWTDKEGKMVRWVPRDEKLDGQMFPSDAFSRYQVVDAFGVMLGRLKLDDNLQPEPIRLSRSRSLKGVVVDEQGDVISGATLTATYGSERFTMSKTAVSDVSGRFEIRGLPPNAAIEVRGAKMDLATTEQDVFDVKSGFAEPLKVVLTKQVTAAPTGRIVDSQGQPVPNAQVFGMRSVVHQKEGFGAESLVGIPMLENLPYVTSDDNGWFRYPATASFNQRMRFKIIADGFLPMSTPFIDGVRRKVVDGNLKLGDFPLIKAPQSRLVNVLCVDGAAGKPIGDAELVFVGALSGRQSIETANDGTAKIKLFDTQQIVAARAEGYQILFQPLKEINSDSLKLTLQKNEAGDSSSTLLGWYSRTPEQYQTAAKKLYDQLEMPGAKDATYYRQSMFFSTQVKVDFPGFKKTLSAPDCSYEYRDTFLLYMSREIFQQAPGESIAFLKQAQVDAQQKASGFAQSALLTDDPELKDELYGEAILAMNNCSGTNRLIAAGIIAKALIVENRFETARSVIESAWESADKMKKLLESEKGELLRAEARIFAPILGIVDPDTAIRLIRLAADQREVESLTNECLAIISLTDPENLADICKRNQLSYEGTGTTRLLELAGDSKNNKLLADWCSRLSGTMQDSMGKVQFCLYAARQTEDVAERDRLIQLAVNAWRQCKIEFWYHWSDPAKVAEVQLARFDNIQSQQLDELVFACLNRAPGPFDTNQKIGVFGNVARMLALRDPELRRHLLQPVFDSGAWLLDIGHRSAFEENLLIQSAVWVDPEWACQIAEEMSARYSSDDPLRKLQLFTTVIKECIELGKTRRN